MIRVLIALGVLLVGATFAPVAGAVTRSTSTTYYDVQGATVPEIRADLDLKRAHDGDGYAEAFYTWSYRAKMNASGSRCRLTSLSIALAQTYAMPHWVAPDDAAPDVRATWDTYLDRLWAHERGHGRISLAAATTIERQLAAMRRPACDRLLADASAAVHARIRMQRTQQLAYDARTGHGATQGATFG